MSTSLSFGKLDVPGYLDSCVSKTQDLWIQGFQSPENSGLLFLRFRAPTISRTREMNSCTTQPRDFGSLWFQYSMAFRSSRIISFCQPESYGRAINIKCMSRQSPPITTNHHPITIKMMYQSPSNHLDNSIAAPNWHATQEIKVLFISLIEGCDNSW